MVVTFICISNYRDKLTSNAILNRLEEVRHVINGPHDKTPSFGQSKYVCTIFNLELGLSNLMKFF